MARPTYPKAKAPTGKKISKFPKQKKVTKGAAKKKATDKAQSSSCNKVATAADIKKHGPIEYVRIGQFDRTGMDDDPPDLPTIFMIVIKRKVGVQPKVEYMKADTRICNGISIGDIETSTTFRPSGNNWIKYDPFFMRLFRDNPTVTECAVWLLNNDYANPPRPGNVLLGNRALLPAPGKLTDAPRRFTTTAMTPAPSGTPREASAIEFMICARDSLTTDNSLNLPGDWRADMRPFEDTRSVMEGFMKSYLRLGRLAEYAGVPPTADEYHGERRLFEKPLAGSWDLELWMQPQAEGCLELFNFTADPGLKLNSLMDWDRSADRRIGRSLYVEVRVVPKDADRVAARRRQSARLWEEYKAGLAAEEGVGRGSLDDEEVEEEEEEDEDDEDEEEGDDEDEEDEQGMKWYTVDKRKRKANDEAGSGGKKARAAGVFISAAKDKQKALAKNKAGGGAGVVADAGHDATGVDTSKKAKSKISAHDKQDVIMSIEESDDNEDDMPDHEMTHAYEHASSNTAVAQPPTRTSHKASAPTRKPDDPAPATVKAKKPSQARATLSDNIMDLGDKPKEPDWQDTDEEMGETAVEENHDNNNSKGEKGNRDKNMHPGRTATEPPGPARARANKVAKKIRDEKRHKKTNKSSERSDRDEERK
ncbi:hypothetical protein MBLNU230_g5101t1 [Neophaeotheca triangularis]